MPPLTMPGPLLGPLGYARGGARVPQSRYSLAFAAASSQYVNVPHSASLNLTAGVSVACWCKIPTGVNVTQFADLLCKENDSQNNNVWALQFQDGANGLIFQARGATVGFQNTGSPYTLPTNVWTHVCGVWGGGTSMILYVDGAAVRTAAVAADTLTTSTGRLDVGALKGNGTFFTGNLDDALVYAGALSGAQVAALAAGTLDPATLGLAGLWRMEEGAGGTTADASGNGNVGSLVNSPAWSSDVPAALA